MRWLLILGAALMFACAGVWLLLEVHSNGYTAGFAAAVEAQNNAEKIAEAAKDDDGHDHGHEAGPHKHGSVIHALNGKDSGAMNPYDHCVRDESINGAEAAGIAYTQGGDWRAVIDQNGHWGEGNCNNLPFYGYAHEACVLKFYRCGIRSYHYRRGIARLAHIRRRRRR